MFILFIVLLIFSFIVQAVTNLPLVVLTFMVFSIFNRSYWILISAFICGFILDIFLSKTLGSDSLFLFIFIYLIYLYERKFEIATNTFVIGSSVLGIILYSIFISRLTLIETTIQSILGIFFSLLIFRIFKIFIRKAS